MNNTSFQLEDLRPSNFMLSQDDPAVVDLLEGINFDDQFEGHEGGSGDQQVEAECGDMPSELEDSSDPDYMQHEDEPEDDIGSDAPSEELDDIEGSGDDDIFVEKPSNKTNRINQLKKMLKNARRTPHRERAPPIPIVEGNSGWCTDPDDDDDIDTPDPSTGKKQVIFSVSDSMKNKNLECYMRFKNVAAYRAALRDWIVRNGYEVDFMKNEKTRVTTVCKVEGCNWRIHASVVQKGPIFQIKTLHGQHDCAKSKFNKHASAKYIGQRLLNTVKDNPDVRIEKFNETILRKCKVNVGYWKTLRAKKEAMDFIRGKDAAEYKLLWDYCETVRNKNPGSRMLLKKVPESDSPMFSRMYFSLAAMKWGFLAGCRPLIGLDGCFLKTPHGGQLLAAVGRDGNDNLFPIALAVVEVESRETWTWFLENLLDDIGGIQDSKWTFISDRQKGLIETLKEIVPHCPHRYCLRHLYANFKEKWAAPELKTLVWRAASTANKNEFEVCLKEIEKADPKRDPKIETAWERLNKISPCHWARSYFPVDCKSDVLVNKLCESFNNLILEAREKPIISMFEWIRNRLTVRIQVKRSAMEKYEQPICPNIIKKINKCRDIANNCYPRWCGRDEFEVEHFGVIYVVDLDKKVCSCGMFQLMGYPCPHALSSIFERRYHLPDYVDDYYKKDLYMKVYDHMIHAVPGPRDYIKIDFVPLVPPVYKKKPGRPKKLRRKAPDEIHRSSTRKGLTHTCSKCLQMGHNMLTCKNLAHPNSKVPKRRKRRKAKAPPPTSQVPVHSGNEYRSVQMQANAPPPMSQMPVHSGNEYRSVQMQANAPPPMSQMPVHSGNEYRSVQMQANAPPPMSQMPTVDSTTNSRRETIANTPRPTTREVNPTQTQSHVYEGRRNAALIGNSRWKDLQHAQTVNDGIQAHKRIRKPTEAQVLQNIKESAKKRIWKP